MPSPAFTVLIATYAGDHPDHLDEALRSIFANTVAPTEVLLVVDGPLPPAHLRVLDAYAQQPTLRTLQQSSQSGLGPALNRGLREATTEWIVRADADDRNAPDRFAVLSAHLDGPLDLIGSAIREIDADGRVVGSRAPPLSESQIWRFLPRRNPFNHMTVAYRRSLALACGGYPNVYLREDYALWARMMRAGARVRNLPDCLVTARAGAALYARRGGWRYAVGEIALQRLLVAEGIKPVWLGLADGILRMLVFLAPLALRRRVYEHWLRERAAA